ncbi:sensor histidine kinase [Shimazuella sp. AN120528]|uniref:sensor histidine kinase n=1 Tax=Shimazuella soli TaxID=1892854 RepID=UPI001F0EA721|nr:sensor histidine kinase [Shimazuella soli]MCH5584766.1 sensor histidine kinase [Shimazuella soli]
MHNILLFLRSKIAWIGMVYAVWILVYLLFALGFYYSGFSYSFDWNLFVYSGLVVTFLLILFLLWRGMKEVPSYALLQQLADQNVVQFQASKGNSLEFDLFWQAYHKLYEQMKADQMQLEQIHKRHLQFIHIWVHQMKTSVSSLSLLAQQYESEQKAHVLEEIDTLNDGLELALTMARLDHFTQDYQIKAVRLVDFVRQVINEKRKLFIRLHIFPKIEMEKEDMEALTDLKWMKFVLEQLIQNACKYTAQVKKEARLTFHIWEEEKQIRLSIKDEGPGIPKQDIPRIFDPFFTGENGRQFAEATGMGLYLVKNIVTSLHHAYEVESEVGVGTTFHILFQKVTKM